MATLLVGGMAGIGLTLSYIHMFGNGIPSCCKAKASIGPSESSEIWNDNQFTHPDGTPEGFTMRVVGPVDEKPRKDTVVCFLEKWEASTAEQPHSHPGDDSTTVVEGEMEIQFFLKKDGVLVEDGKPITLVAGQTGYINAGRIHDAKYVKKCRLIYVHNSSFGFNEAA